MRTTQRAAQGILGTLAVLALTVLPATPAAAHAELKSTDPKADSTAAVLLTQVTLTFNQPVKQQLTTVAITGADGATYSDGTARAVDATVIQAVKPLPQGRVTVGWRTVSADGHSIQGQFAFTNTAATPTPPAASTPAPPPAAPTPTGSADAIAPRSDETSMTTIWIAVGAGLAILAIAAGFVLLRRRSGRS